MSDQAQLQIQFKKNCTRVRRTTRIRTASFSNLSEIGADRFQNLFDPVLDRPVLVRESLGISLNSQSIMLRIEKVPAHKI